MIRSTVEHAVVVCKGAEDEVAGLRSLDRDRDRLQVAHLAHEHDVGVFPQGRPQRRLEPVGMADHLALVEPGSPGSGGRTRSDPRS